MCSPRAPDCSGRGTGTRHWHPALAAGIGTDSGTDSGTGTGTGTGSDDHFDKVFVPRSS